MLDPTSNDSSKDAGQESSAAEAAAPAVTTTTTSTRRRAAARPAGPPVAVAFQAPPPGLAPALPKPDPVEDTAEPQRKGNAGNANRGANSGANNNGSNGAGGKNAKNTNSKNDASQNGGKDSNGGSDDDSEDDDDLDENGSQPRRRRSRGGRRRRKPESEGGDDAETDDSGDDEDGSDDDDSDDGESGGSPSSRRRRRRARAGEQSGGSPDDPENTVVKVRQGRSAEDEITGVTGSTRLEAKKQRRREGREAGRRRAPIVSEAEFLARRESVKREMVVRQRNGESGGDYTQIAVLEDGVLVEHYVARESQTSVIGNVYLGKVQNVLPSMEAAFVDIGAGRNAVLYAGEVDWSALANGKPRKIEEVLTPGQVILVQVTKDPIGQKGARLTSQVSLPGRFLVLVPSGHTSGISRKLPENERARLKSLLKEVLPDEAGFIVRTAAEGATEDQLTRDVTALTARWKDIESKVAAGNAPELLYSEPDLMIKVIRDLFNEDFNSLVVEGDDAWDMVKGYVDHVAPDLGDRVSRWEPPADKPDTDSFAAFRIDEQINKALDRKVHLPSGGSLIIDRTEAMTVVDVNTGKYTGSGGNLEETVTKNNLEAAEEVVRQLRLRDIGGIIVVDFIDMVLESNRELVLRRLVECLGRDRTRHQVAEVTSLGLVQMTRKRIGTGLLESFSTDCEHCKGRGVTIAEHPVEPKKDDGGQRRGGRGGRNRSGKGGNAGNGGNNAKSEQKNDQSEKQEQSEKADKPAKAEKSEQSDKADTGKADTGKADTGKADNDGQAKRNDTNSSAKNDAPASGEKPAAESVETSSVSRTTPPVLTDQGEAP